jgi:hypothetical protein
MTGKIMLACKIMLRDSPFYTPHLQFALHLLFLFSCNVGKVQTNPKTSEAAKEADVPCADPDLDLVSELTTVNLCDGSTSPGQLRSCSLDGQSSCLATQDFPTIEPKDLDAKNLRTGITFAGISGTYPSQDNPLAGSDSSLFDLNQIASLTSTGSVQYWTSAGIKSTLNVVPTATLDLAANADQIVSTDTFYAGILVKGLPGLLPNNIKSGVSIFGVTGTAEFDYLDPWHLRAGITVGNITGKLKLSCKNMADLSTWDMPAIASITNNASSGDPMTGDGIAHWWETIDDYNFTGATLPRDNPWGNDDFLCDESNWMAAGLDSGDTAGLCNDVNDTCAYFDQISRTYWSEIQGTAKTWANAVLHCDSLNGANYAGFSSGWRLATILEWQTAVINGLAYLEGPNFLPNSHLYFWSATSESGASYRNTGPWAHIIRPSNGRIASGNSPKSSSREVMCVRWEDIP